MAIIKKKSLIVAFVSSAVIAAVLMATLAGYYAYLEYRGAEFNKRYEGLLKMAKADVYSKYIAIDGLEARIENSGALKGKPVLNGTITNRGVKDISDVVVRTGFLDKDGAVIYETDMKILEGALAGGTMPRINIPYLNRPPDALLKAGERLVFKKILETCPTEIFIELREGDKPKKAFGKWSGRLAARAVSLGF
jgi:hypothetical protein